MRSPLQWFVGQVAAMSKTEYLAFLVATSVVSFLVGFAVLTRLGALPALILFALLLIALFFVSRGLHHHHTS